MQQIIDIKNLAKYEKNNRIEAKRARGGQQHLEDIFGFHKYGRWCNTAWCG